MGNSKHINGDLSVGRNMAAGGFLNIQGNATIGHNLKVKGWLEAPNIKDINKGVFATVEALNAAYPNPKVGWVAGVLGVKDEGLETEENVVFLYMAVGGAWVKQEGYEMVFQYDFEQPLEEIYRTLVDNTIGGFSCATAGDVADKVIVTQRGAAGLINWAAFRMSFENANTAASGVTLTVKDEDNVSHGTYPLYYNGDAVTNSNTWESGVEYEVMFDPDYNDGEGAFFIVRIVRRFDEEPTSGSGNPVTSDGVWHAINGNDVIDTNQMKDAAVTTPKIADKNVTWEKLDENTKQLIYAPGGVRIPLAQVFGNDEHIGISQKVLTESRDNLQSQIDAIVAGDTTVDLSVSTNAIFVGETTQVTLKATSSRTASTIKVEKDGEDMPEEASDTDHLTVTDSLTPEVKGTTEYKAKFVIFGNNKDTSVRKVSAVYPIYYAVGATRPATSSDAWHELLARTTAVGVQLSNLTTASGDHIFIEVPNGIQMGDIYLDDIIDTKLEKETVTTDRVDGEGGAYTCYKNVEARGAGTYNYKIQ